MVLQFLKKLSTSRKQSGSGLKPTKPSRKIALESLEARLVPTTITRTSTPVFYNDLNPPAGSAPIAASYASYQITNNDGIDYADAWVSIGDFRASSGPVVVNTSTYASTKFHIGALPQGATKAAFFYLASNSDSITAAQSHTITVFEGDPVTGKKITAADFSFSSTSADKAVQNTIAAESNKTEGFEVKPETVTLGDSFIVTVKGHTGTIGDAMVMAFSPASGTNWRSDAFQLTSSSITLSGANTGTFKDTLYIPSSALTSRADTEYTATYTFRATGTVAGSVPVVPVAFISSGQNVKHNKWEKQDWAVKSTSNTLKLSSTVDKTSLATGDTVIYTLKLSNSDSKNPASIDQWVNNLPAGASYIPGTTTLDGKNLFDPAIAGQQLVWNNMQGLAAGVTSTLVFKAKIPATPGTYTNTSIVKVGSTQIDTTLDIQDNKPATVATVVTNASAPKITSPNQATFVYGTKGFFKVVSEGDVTNVYSIASGTLPAGLTLDRTTGVLSGTPASGTTGSWNITFQVTNSLGKTTQSFNLTVAKVALTVTASAGSKVYGDKDPGLTYSITTGALVTGDNLTGTLVRSAGESAGIYSIRQGTLAANSNYSVTFVGANFTVNKAELKVAANPKAKTYGESSPALTYTLTGLKNSDTQAVVSGSLARAPGENAGVYAILQGDIKASTNYQILFVSADFTINKADLKVAANPQAKSYGEADPKFTYTVTGFRREEKDDILNGSLGRTSGSNVGSYNINCGTLEAGSNYNIKFFGASLVINPRVITLNAHSVTKTYGDKDPALTWSIASGSLASGDQLTGSLARSAGENVGKYTITRGTLSGGSNYTIKFNNGTFLVSQREITVAADAVTKSYGYADPALAYHFTAGSMAFGEKLSGNLTRSKGENVGKYSIGQGNLAATSNYKLSFVGSNLVISPRVITVTATSFSKVYGTSDPLLTYSVTNGTLLNGDRISGAPARVGGEIVGNYGIGKGSLAVGANYSLNFVPGNLAITPRAITVTATDRAKVYGDADPALTYSVTAGSLVRGDSLKGDLTREVGQNVGSYQIRQGSLSAGSNYSITWIPATLKVAQRPITVSAATHSKTYGNQDPELIWKVTTGSLAYADKLAGNLARAAGENAGNYAINQGSLANANYKITFVGANFQIKVRQVTVTADTLSKVYGDNDPVLTYKIPATSMVNGDKLTGALTRTTGEAVGSYGIRQGSLSASSNYQLIFVGANLKVTSRNVYVTPNNAEKTYGDAYAFKGDEFTVKGLAFKDTISSVTLASSGTSSRALAGNFEILASRAVGTNLSNYVVYYTKGNLAVNRANLDIIAGDGSKVYGTVASISGTKFSVKGLVNGDSVKSVAFASPGASATAGAGSYPLLPAGALGSGLQNYNINYVSGVLEVSKASLVVTANSRVKNEGSGVNFIGTEYSVSGLLNADKVVSATVFSKGSDSSAPTGDYPIQIDDAQGKGIENYDIIYVEGLLKVIPKEDFRENLGQGTFTTDDSGKIQIDFRYDGGAYQSQMGIYSLAGMIEYKPGSPEFIREVARRVLTSSGEGFLVINDITDAAKNSDKLKTDGQFNQGDYKGPQTFQLDSNAQFGMVLVPAGTFEDLLKDPSLGGAKRPLFSNSRANPTQEVRDGVQMADLTGDGTIFSWEDYRLDGGKETNTPVSDMDYNDMIFALMGAKSDAVGYHKVVDPDKDITKDPAFKDIIS